MTGLVEQNLGLARHAANLYVARYPRLRSMLDDLEQEAFLGLVQAAEKFDPAKGRFATYAWWWASARIREYVHSYVNPVSGVPNHQRDGTPAMFMEQTAFEDHMVGAANVDEENLDAVRVSERFRAELAEMMRTRTNMHNPERDVGVFLSASFGESGGAPELGATFGVSRERIRQIKERVRPYFEELAADYREEAA